MIIQCICLCVANSTRLTDVAMIIHMMRVQMFIQIILLLLRLNTILIMIGYLHVTFNNMMAHTPPLIKLIIMTVYTMIQNMTDNFHNELSSWCPPLLRERDEAKINVIQTYLSKALIERPFTTS